jgi:hypothetical protein
MDTFVPIVTGILGEQILKSAAIKVKQQVSRVDGLCSIADDFFIRSNFQGYLKNCYFFPL